jgi:hypothetical protein
MGKTSDREVVLEINEKKDAAWALDISDLRDPGRSEGNHHDDVDM